MRHLLDGVAMSVPHSSMHSTHWLISTQVFTPYELEVRSLRSRDLEAYKKPTPLTAQFDRECRYDFQQQGLSDRKSVV